jgi:hypothetical protein
MGEPQGEETLQDVQSLASKILTIGAEAQYEAIMR